MRGIAGAVATAAGIAGLQLVAAPPAGAQAIEELDAGQFEIRVQGSRVGIETFRIWRVGGTTRAAGRLTMDDAPADPTSIVLEGDEDYRPTGYELRSTTSPVSRVLGAWAGDRFRLQVTSDRGERWKEFLARGEFAVLEPGVAHHLSWLLRQLGADPVGAQLPVILPGRAEQVTAVVTAATDGTVQVGGREVAARRFDLDVGGGSLRAWVGGDRRLLQVQWPAENKAAIRLPESG